jgi:hypothetical protein
MFLREIFQHNLIFGRNYCVSLETQGGFCKMGYFLRIGKHTLEMFRMLFPFLMSFAQKCSFAITFLVTMCPYMGLFVMYVYLCMYVSLYGHVGVFYEIAKVGFIIISS